MPVISWPHLRYERERAYYNDIQEPLAEVLDEYREYTRNTQQHQHGFFAHLSHAFKISEHPKFAEMTRTLSQRLNLHSDIVVFLSQSPVAEACCMPHFDSDGGAEQHHLIVRVSQHFLNDLNEQEQLSILGHELAHTLFKHVEIPSQALMESELSGIDTNAFKQDLRKWMMCSEISCDIVGMVACGLDERTFCSAMMKFSTGLQANILSDYASQAPLVDLAIKQYDEIADWHLDPSLSSHPLTPLRLKLATAISDSPLLGAFGRDVDEEELEALRSAHNERIDKVVSTIYPELVPTGQQRGRDAAHALTLAVALADGEISDEEVEVINTTLQDREGVSELTEKIRRKADAAAPEALKRRLVDKAIEITHKKALGKQDILRILRQALLVAAADCNIDKDELDTVYEYAKVFDLRKEDIVAIVQQFNT